jgi:tetrahydromethanopterin S-methyltransferase subunit G
MIPDQFWPTSLVGWITVMGMFGTMGSVLWAFAQTMARLNGLGERLNEVVKELSNLDGRVGVAERSLILNQADRTNLHEAIARISVEMQTLTKVAQAAQVERMEDLGEIRERLVRIETKVDIRGGKPWTT